MSGIIAGGPRTADGAPVVAQTATAYSDAPTRFFGEVYEFANGSGFADMRVARPMFLQGGAFWAHGAALRDRVSLSVVDVDGVIGAVGAVLAEYVVRAPVPPGQQVQNVDAATAAYVPAGVYLRVSYEAADTAAVTMGVLYRVLLA